MPLLPRAEALQRLREAARRAGRPVLWDDLPASVMRSLLHHCGSLRAARRAAGVPPVRYPRRWSLERVVTEIRRVHRQGVRIVQRDLHDAGRADLASAIREYAGGFARARRLARVPDPSRHEESERESWDEERVVEEILALHKAGEPLAVSRAPSKLVAAGERVFGSWGAAIAAAGLDYRAIRMCARYTDDELLDKLRRLAVRRPNLTVAELRRLALGGTVAERFGSIEAASRRAGLRRWPVRVMHPVLSRSATIAALRARRRAGKQVHEVALRRDDVRLLHSARRHFGTVAQARDAAGLKPDFAREQWTKENIVRHLLARRARGQPINAGAVEKELPSLYRAAVRLFGSYYALASRYGAKRKYKTWTVEATLAELRRVARRKGGVVRAIDLRGGVVVACQRHFGSFAAARRAAGVSPAPLRWTRDRVIRELRAAERGRRRTSRLGPTLRPTLREAARRLFGGIDDAREAAGLDPL
jgi:hypothetical protein